MNIKLQNLDYYSGFEGENEIRFYANSKSTKFQLKRCPNSSGGYFDVQIHQGEFGIHFFSLWEGYFDSLMNIIDRSNYTDLPKVIKDWIEVKGWRWDDLMPYLITEQELNWFINQIKIVIEDYKRKGKESIIKFKCMVDLLTFLEVALKEEMEVRISDE
ncbi:MAG: hypothetical protein GQ574_00330 [Crocinitomix sp.]|nr:hypothetical protein [Crocinitomix sp.]